VDQQDRLAASFCVSDAGRPDVASLPISVGADTLFFGLKTSETKSVNGSLRGQQGRIGVLCDSSRAYVQIAGKRRTRMKPGSTHQKVATAALLVIALGFEGCSKGPTDDEITKNIQAAYYADPQVRNDQITVAVKNSEVTLSGTVATDADHMQAYKLANQVAGVKKITDQLQVNTAQVAPPPETAPPPPAEARATPREKKKSASEASAPSAAPVAEASQPAPPPALPPPPQPTPVTVPAGADVRVRTIDAISSESGQPGQTYQASLAAPIVVEDTVVVQQGATVFLQVTGAKQAGKIKGSSELTLALDHLIYHDQTYPLASSAVQQIGESRGKQTAKRAGLGAAIGAGIGAIAGGGKGAAIGAGIGGGGAMAYQAFTKGKAVNVPSETLLDFTLAQPVTIMVPPKKSASSN
jgi:hypothetical protein